MKSKLLILAIAAVIIFSSLGFACGESCCGPLCSFGYGAACKSKESCYLGISCWKDNACCPSGSTSSGDSCLLPSCYDLCRNTYSNFKGTTLTSGSNPYCSGNERVTWAYPGRQTSDKNPCYCAVGGDYCPSGQECNNGNCVPVVQKPTCDSACSTQWGSLYLGTSNNDRGKSCPWLDSTYVETYDYMSGTQSGLNCWCNHKTMCGAGTTCQDKQCKTSRDYCTNECKKYYTSMYYASKCGSYNYPTCPTGFNNPYYLSYSLLSGINTVDCGANCYCQYKVYCSSGQHCEGNGNCVGTITTTTLPPTTVARTTIVPVTTTISITKPTLDDKSECSKGCFAQFNDLYDSYMCSSAKPAEGYVCSSFSANEKKLLNWVPFDAMKVRNDVARTPPTFSSNGGCSSGTCWCKTLRSLLDECQGSQVCYNGKCTDRGTVSTTVLQSVTRPTPPPGTQIDNEGCQCSDPKYSGFSVAVSGDKNALSCSLITTEVRDTIGGIVMDTVTKKPKTTSSYEFNVKKCGAPETEGSRKNLVDGNCYTGCMYGDIRENGPGAGRQCYCLKAVYINLWNPTGCDMKCDNSDKEVNANLVGSGTGGETLGPGSWAPGSTNTYQCGVGTTAISFPVATDCGKNHPAVDPSCCCKLSSDSKVSGYTYVGSLGKAGLCRESCLVQCQAYGLCQKNERGEIPDKCAQCYGCTGSCTASRSITGTPVYNPSTKLLEYPLKISSATCPSGDEDCYCLNKAGTTTTIIKTGTIYEDTLEGACAAKGAGWQCYSIKAKEQYCAGLEPKGTWHVKASLANLGENLILTSSCSGNICGCGAGKLCILDLSLESMFTAENGCEKTTTPPTYTSVEVKGATYQTTTTAPKTGTTVPTTVVDGKNVQVGTTPIGEKCIYGKDCLSGICLPDISKITPPATAAPTGTTVPTKYVCAKELPAPVTADKCDQRCGVSDDPTPITTGTTTQPNPTSEICDLGCNCKSSTACKGDYACLDDKSSAIDYATGSIGTCSLPAYVRTPYVTTTVPAVATIVPTTIIDNKAYQTGEGEDAKTCEKGSDCLSGICVSVPEYVAGTGTTTGKTIKVCRTYATGLCGSGTNKCTEFCGLGCECDTSKATACTGGLVCLGGKCSAPEGSLTPYLTTTVPPSTTTPTTGATGTTGTGTTGTTAAGTTGKQCSGICYDPKYESSICTNSAKKCFNKIAGESCTGADSGKVCIARSPNNCISCSAQTGASTTATTGTKAVATTISPPKTGLCQDSDNKKCQDYLVNNKIMQNLGLDPNKVYYNCYNSESEKKTMCGTSDVYYDRCVLGKDVFGVDDGRICCPSGGTYGCKSSTTATATTKVTTTAPKTTIPSTVQVPTTVQAGTTYTGPWCSSQCSSATSSATKINCNTGKIDSSVHSITTNYCACDGRCASRKECCPDAYQCDHYQEAVSKQTDIPDFIKNSEVSMNSKNLELWKNYVHC